MLPTTKIKGGKLSCSLLSHILIRIGTIKASLQNAQQPYGKHVAIKFATYREDISLKLGWARIVIGSVGS